jgi:hypothetical protein
MAKREQMGKSRDCNTIPEIGAVLIDGQNSITSQRSEHKEYNSAATISRR